MKKRYNKFFNEEEKYIAYNPDLRYLIQLHNDAHYYKLKNEERLNFDSKYQDYLINKLKQFYKESKSRYIHIIKEIPSDLSFDYKKNINNFFKSAKENLDNLLNYGYDAIQAEYVIMDLHGVIRNLLDFDKK